MERKTAHHFEQELLNIFDLYVHGDIDRRGFLDRAAAPFDIAWRIDDVRR